MFDRDEPRERSLHVATTALCATLRTMSERSDFPQILENVLSHLPPGTADGGAHDPEPPLFISIGRQKPEVTRVIMQFMTEAGLLAVDDNGETFLHKIVRHIGQIKFVNDVNMATQHNHPYLMGIDVPGQIETYLDLVRDSLCKISDPRVLLSARCEEGITAADLAEELHLPSVAAAVRPHLAKNAAT